MQSSASRRALSALASKLHPQLPLTARESQQLLNLLTTSFRNHLDREHPVPVAEDSQAKRSTKALVKKPQHNASPVSPDSSYSSAHQHINSILTNPLFAVKPRRRGSGSAAVDVLRDPVAWFRDQIAIGAADLRKAAMCLEMLERSAGEADPGTMHKPYDKRTPGAMIAEWLRTSGLDTSAEFVNPLLLKSIGSNFLERLIALLVAEGAETPIWRWFTHPPEKRIQETGLEASHIFKFRTKLLLGIVSNLSHQNPDEALTSFLRAVRMMQAHEFGVTQKILQPAGAHLVNRIMTNPGLATSPELYDSFLNSTRLWLGRWHRAVESMLWVHHPTKPSALPGLEFIQESKGAITFISHSQSRKKFLVQLSLSVAHQLLAEEKYQDALIPMAFTKDHLAEFVLSKHGQESQQATVRRKERKEQQNLKLLDQLIPT